MKNAILICLLMSVMLSSSSFAQAPRGHRVEAHVKNYLYVDGLEFKDLNDNGKLDVYEDWRKPIPERVEDLVSQMNLQEKAGMLLIDTMNSGPDGQLPEQAGRFVFDEHMTRFIFRNYVTGTPASGATSGRWRRVSITPYDAAQFMNSVQELAESTRLGIPVLFKSNGRNHYTHSAQVGIDVDPGAFSQFPKEAGLAAAALGEGNMDVIKQFSKVMAAEWSSIGLRGMYGYMADLATEPRWNRVSGTFTEDADLASDIMATLVTHLQRRDVGYSNVFLTIKHFPGGGPQLKGYDPHYMYGREQTYPAGMFDYHWKPFKVAIDAGLVSIMPYYGIPVGQKYKPSDVGMSFSKGIITKLLREELGFKGYVNSDTGIMTGMPWGVEDLTVEERVVMSINAGTDVLSGFSSNAVVLGMIGNGLTEVRVDEACRRMLAVQFELGLFEKPYVDPDRADRVVGRTTHAKIGYETQQKSIVLLKTDKALPLPVPTEKKPVKLFTLGMNAETVANYAMDTEGAGSYTVIDGGDSTIAIKTVDADYALIRVRARYGGRGSWRIPWDQQKPGNGYGSLALSTMSSTDWQLSPSLEDIQAVMKRVGAKRTIVSIYFQQPYVIDKDCGILDAGAILATFGVRDDALMDVLTGAFKPQGKLPIALANSQAAIEAQDSDAPGYDKAGTLFPFGHGLSY